MKRMLTLAFIGMLAFPGVSSAQGYDGVIAEGADGGYSSGSSGEGGDEQPIDFNALSESGMTGEGAYLQDDYYSSLTDTPQDDFEQRRQKAIDDARAKKQKEVQAAKQSVAQVEGERKQKLDQQINDYQKKFEELRKQQNSGK
jgi:hypothetical protein